ncbi:MAG: hypothetical protein AB1918_01610 [Pseudomonadota bacterium]
MTRLATLAVLLALAALPAHAAGYWSELAARISAEVAKAEEHALAGRVDDAKKAVTAAYFGLFESEKMEAAIRTEIGAKHAAQREKLFGDLRKLAARGTPEEIRAATAQLRAGLAEDAAALDKAGIPADVFAVNQ